MGVLLLVWLLCSGEAQAGALAQRLENFPHWSGPPPVQPAEGDLIYPDWMAGTWVMTTTLVDLAAPLAPDIQTPGFEGNQDFLDQPIRCQVRFIATSPLPRAGFLPRVIPQGQPQPIVADRAFNGLNLARAYLGDAAVQQVQVDPQNPNRQLTQLRGDRQLVSTITGRAIEQPDADTFLTTEVFQQVFRGTAQPYLNQVETTTAYRRGAKAGRKPSTTDNPKSASFSADQVTAIYLSPQDPDYFQSQGQPVALYRYRLNFEAI
ncbi:MAG: hypothetical protein HC812_17395 [Leptolyngbya sp. RL_3_1]|nr:hypothetical protein [Leptolyngbya sp. RL_3_1]